MQTTSSPLTSLGEAAADHVAAQNFIVALLKGQNDVSFAARGCIGKRGVLKPHGTPRQRRACEALRKLRSGIYVLLKAMAADAKLALQKLPIAATVTFLQNGAFWARAQNDKESRRKRKQQDRSLRVRVSTLGCCAGSGTYLISVGAAVVAGL